MPVSGLTAWQALEPAMPLAGKRVLVHGGAGGVGSFAVQVRRWLCCFEWFDGAAQRAAAYLWQQPRAACKLQPGLPVFLTLPESAPNAPLPN